ncbi:putative uncharacterized protein [Clostridium sp. CAG:505]|nr:putative uncharacterized protein [Clostridium sp. CAG:505]
MNQFLNQHGFPNTGTTEQTDLTAFCVRCQQVDNFDTCFQYFYCGALFFKIRGFPVNLPVLFRLHRFAAVNGFPQKVKHSAQYFFANRNLNAGTCCGNFQSFGKAFAGIHHDAAHDAFPQLLCYFHYPCMVFYHNSQCFLNFGYMLLRKTHVHNSTHDLYDFSLFHTPVPPLQPLLFLGFRTSNDFRDFLCDTSLT